MASTDDGPESGAATDHTAHESAATNTSMALPPPPEQGLKCPRCDSPNTKFCYYNNYSLSQPRHFCKTCRRYWTKGGALRNVPVGGGCRKSNKTKSKSTALSRLSLHIPTATPTDHHHHHQMLGSAASDFQLGFLPFSAGRLHSSPNSYTMSAAGEIPSPTLSYPAVGGTNTNMNSIASSIESLSFINQDLHLKLQQQRMAMLFSSETSKDAAEISQMQQQQQPISLSPDFGECGGGAIQIQKPWFAETSFALSSSSTGTDHVNRIGTHDHDGINNGGSNINYWNGTAAGSSGWNDMPQFTAMP